MGAVERVLAWEGCVNIRDLGGLETASGARTRHGAVVRADNVRRLSPAGWQAAHAHGVRRLVDLRFQGEERGEPEAPETMEIVEVSLFGQFDRERERAFNRMVSETDDFPSAFAAGYIHMLETRFDQVAAAVAAIADTDPGHCVLVHCFAGKDRTGIVCALLLDLVDVPDDTIATDYAASEQNMTALFTGWLATAEDEAELELRRRVSRAPSETMHALLSWLDETAGGAEGYLRSAGLDDGHLSRIRTRLVGTSSECASNL